MDEPVLPAAVPQMHQRPVRAAAKAALQRLQAKQPSRSPVQRLGTVTTKAGVLRPKKGRATAKRPTSQMHNNGKEADCIANVTTEVEPVRKKRHKRTTTSRKDQSNTAAMDAGGPEATSAKDAAADITAHVFRGTISRNREQQLLLQGYKFVIGVDEAGRGPLAGPVVTAACALPPEFNLAGIDDSKKLNEHQREELYHSITAHPGVMWSAQIVPAATIDDINILQATLLGMRQAVEQVVEAFKQQHNLPSAIPAASGAVEAPAADNVLSTAEDNSSNTTVCPCYCLVDGNKMPASMPIPGEIAKGGDRLHYCIAAASIIAKVTRDRLMEQYDAQYPQYGFGKHKGYGTAAHVAAIKAHGPCAIHRRSFEPIKSMVASADDGS